MLSSNKEYTCTYMYLTVHNQYLTFTQTPEVRVVRKFKYFNAFCLERKLASRYCSMCPSLNWESAVCRYTTTQKVLLKYALRGSELGDTRVEKDQASACNHLLPSIRVESLSLYSLAAAAPLICTKFFI